MFSRLTFPLLAAALILAACGRQDEAAANNGSAAAPPPPGNTAAAAPAAATAPAPAYTLAANGLEPGIAFGMPRGEAIAAASAAFGEPSSTGRNDECGAGPMDFANFGGLQLAFQEDRLVGWSVGEAEPALRTATGLAVGAPRTALGSAEIDEESSLGPEFEVDGVAGVLDENGERIVALWAGIICQFR